MTEKITELEKIVDRLIKLQSDDIRFRLALKDDETEGTNKFVLIDSKDIKKFGVSQLDADDKIEAVYEGDVEQYAGEDEPVIFIEIINNPLIIMPYPVSMKETEEKDVVYISLHTPKLLKLV